LKIFFSFFRAGHCTRHSELVIPDAPPTRCSPSESVLFAGVKSSEGKLVQPCPYHPRLYHFSPGFADVSGTKREKRGTGPERSEVFRREPVRASIDALQCPIARGPVFRPVSMARYGVFGTPPEFFFQSCPKPPRLPGSPVRQRRHHRTRQPGQKPGTLHNVSLNRARKMIGKNSWIHY